MNRPNNELENTAEISFENFILDASKETKLVVDIMKSNEIIDKINQESIMKTKQKVEGIYIYI